MPIGLQGSRMYYTQNNQIKLLKIFIVLSLVLHAALLITQTSHLLITTSSTETEKEKIIKIKLLTDNQKVARQIVQTQAINQEKPNEKAFLGKQDNKVDRQTKTATVGSFKEAGKGMKEATAMVNTISEQQKISDKLKNLNLSALGVKSEVKAVEKINKKPIPAQVAKGLNNGKRELTGLGQNNDYVEDIPLGDFNKLNTQEFEFYGFYHRIREKLEQFWGSNIQEQAEKMVKSGRAIASDTNHITSLEIYINEKGEIINVNLNSTSGVRELDEAAVKTFNQAGPFPNPPKGMLKNGRAKIKWSFVVNT
jgi:TonB family protein